MSPGGFVSLPPDARARVVGVAHAGAVDVVEPPAGAVEVVERAVVGVGRAVRAPFVPDVQAATTTPTTPASATPRSALIMKATVGPDRLRVQHVEVRAWLKPARVLAANGSALRAVPTITP